MCAFERFTSLHTDIVEIWSKDDTGAPISILLLLLGVVRSVIFRLNGNVGALIDGGCRLIGNAGALIDGGCRLIFFQDFSGQGGEDLLDIRALQGRSLQEGHVVLVCQLLTLLFSDSPAALKIRLGTHQDSRVAALREKLVDFNHPSADCIE